MKINTKIYNFYVPELRDVIFIREDFECINGHCTVKMGSKWDGCTCSPDTKKTEIACMVHDALCRYGKELGLKRKVADLWLLKLLKESNFAFAYVYYYAVRTFGFLRF